MQSKKADETVHVQEVKDPVQEAEYVLEKIKECQEKGIATYLVEYTKNTDWKAAISAYCKKHHITYYNPTIK